MGSVQQIFHDSKTKADKLVTNLNLFIFLNSWYIQHLQGEKKQQNNCFELNIKFKIKTCNYFSIRR